MSMSKTLQTMTLIRIVWQEAVAEAQWHPERAREVEVEQEDGKLLEHGKMLWRGQMGQSAQQLKAY